MESGTTFWKINLHLLIAAAIIIPWFAVRRSIDGSPNGLTVLLEWSGLIALTVGMCWLRFGIPRWFGLLNAIVLCALIARSIADLQSTSPLALLYPGYWWGFGGRVLVATLFIALTVLSVMARSGGCDSRGESGGVSVARPLKGVITLGIVAWTLPSVLQPMDSWLNMGDSTEKVLDELAGWTVGNIPGVHSSWAHNSLLGLPLAPLSLTDQFGEMKVVIVVLYTNALVVAVPLMMAYVVSRVLPQIGNRSAFSLALISVSISGSPGNSSLFQELSFLARGILPVALGALMIYALQVDVRIEGRSAVGLGLLSGLTLMNNFEYGIGAAVAAVGTVYFSSHATSHSFRLISRMFIALVAAVAVVTLPAAIHGGDWLNRRLGVWADVLRGSGAMQSNNAGSWPPALGLATLCFVLGVVGVVLGIGHLRTIPAKRQQRAAAVGSLYFGIWVVASAPYFLNGGGAGAFRTQFLFIPFALLAFSILGIANTPIRTEGQNQDWSRAKFTDLFSRVPIVLICSLVLAAVVQVPNGFGEWQRVQTPNLNGKTEDEWSPHRLDWIQTDNVLELIDDFGGSEKVGWWFGYGNAIESLTGVENLLGTTGFETVRSSVQLHLACEPLIKSRKHFIISFDNMSERMQSCGLSSVREVTNPNDDGLVVYRTS